MTSKNAALALFLPIAVCGGWILSCRPADPPRKAAQAGANRGELKSFWHVYGEASELRTAGRLRQAVERYRQALEIKPEHEDTLYYVATCLADLGEYPEAVRYCEKVVAQNPSSHRGFSQLGALLSNPLPGATLDFARARNCFLRNVEINREESGPFMRLGRLSLFQDRIEEAQKYFDTAAGFQSPEGMFLAGALRYSRGDFQTASSLFRRILEINAREKKISGRGVHSEGDIQSSGASLTPMERAGIQALVFLYWTSCRLGGYSSDKELESRISRGGKGDDSLRFKLQPKESERPASPSIRDLWDSRWRSPAEWDAFQSVQADLDKDGFPERIKFGNPPRTVRIRWDKSSESAIGSGERPVVALEAQDFDRDGAADILFLEWKGGLKLFRNTGSRRFEDVSAGSGLPTVVDEAFAMTSLDYDCDGYRDILVAPYAPYASVLMQIVGAGDTKYSAHLFRNLGLGRFQEVRDFPGLAPAHGVMRAVTADFDRDGYPDLLFACGGLDPLRLEPSVVLRNQRGKSFTAAFLLPSHEDPVCALGADASDLDHDGFPDISLRTTTGVRVFRNLHPKTR